MGLGVLLALAPVGWSLSGCGILDEGGAPRNARVVLEGGGGEAVELVTSNDFAIVTDDDGETSDVYLYSADTTSVTPSFDQRYSLGSGVRFFVAAASEVTLAGAVTMEVFIDGERRFKGSSTLGETTLEFLYSFR